MRAPLAVELLWFPSASPAGRAQVVLRIVCVCVCALLAAELLTRRSRQFPSDGLEDWTRAGMRVRTEGVHAAYAAERCTPCSAAQCMLMMCTEGGQPGFRALEDREQKRLHVSGAYDGPRAPACLGEGHAHATCRFLKRAQALPATRSPRWFKSWPGQRTTYRLGSAHLGLSSAQPRGLAVHILGSAVHILAWTAHNL